MDRFFDNYVMNPTQTLVSDRMRSEGQRDAKGVSDARNLLDVAYRLAQANRLRDKRGRRVVTLRSLTAPRRPRYSMRTGCIPLATNFQLPAPIAVDYSPAPRLPAQLMRRGPTASCFRSARQTAIDEHIALTSAAERLDSLPLNNLLTA